MKPKILFDIKNGGRLDSLVGKKIINLNYQKITRIPIKKIARRVFVFVIVAYFIFGPVISVAPGDVRAAQKEEERKALESQLAELEGQISQYESTIAQYKSQGKNLQSEIKSLEAKVGKLGLQIKAINLSLTRLDEEINATQGQIVNAEDQISINKNNLSDLLQTLYENDKQGMAEILLKNNQLSDFFGDLNNIMAVQDNLRLVIGKVVESRLKLIDQKQDLALEKSDKEALKIYQDSQRLSIKKAQEVKNTLLKETKGKEAVYQKILIETQKTAAQIRSQIYNLIGGGELQFGDAYKLAKSAEKATGVRAALILAVLDRESALGKNVGRCDYQTAMHPTRDIPAFLTIIDELGLKSSLDRGTIKVSCANSDGAYGGAMGPAQFIPSTWAGYKDRIADMTGNHPPSPWNNADAFMATALYLKDSGAAGGSAYDEKVAAAKYYAGSRWRYHLNGYAARVVAQAQEFEDDIAILNS